MKNERQNKQDEKEDSQGGWTFIETLIVMGIILILSSSVGFMAVKYLDKAKSVTAKSQIETFVLALDAYFLDCGSYPSATEGLNALWTKPSGAEAAGTWNGPYLSKPVPKDPWNNAYEYQVPGPDGLPYGIRSLGRDNQEGGENDNADIVSWE